MRSSRKTLNVISVIIPTLNEAANIAATIRSAGQGGEVEVIVADGGSTDATAAIVRDLGIRLVESLPGRALQMNTAARLEGYPRAVRRTLRLPFVSAGAFSLLIDARRASMRFVAYWANWRSRVLGTPYGDQAIFLSAETFRDIGGYPEMPIMEDFELIRRLSRMGRVVTVPQRVTTSARRWVNMGVLRTTVLNQLIVVSYLLGASPRRLARWYRGGRGVSPVT
jgi:glycosyltransferase involved in cell wall biosynthesis